MVPRNLFGGANKNDRVEETLVSSSPHRGAVTCLTHTRHGTYGSFVGPLVFSGSNDQTVKGSIFMTIENDERQLFTSVAWDLAHEQLVLADASGVVQIWNTYTESLLLNEKVANAVASTGPRKGQTLKALLGFHSSKADGMLYGMSPAEGCFFCWKMVKDGGSTLIGRHDDGIVGLGFQQAEAFAARETRNTTTSLVEAATAPPDVVTEAVAAAAVALPAAAAAGFGLYREDNAVVAEGARGSAGTPPAAEPGRRGGASRPGGRSSGGRGAAGVARGLDSELDAANEGGEQQQEEEEEKGKKEKAGFESVVLSASMDGTVRAWEMLGKSEKYRMRHPNGVEVTSMLVLPGGAILVTGADDGSVRFWRLDTGAGESFGAHDNTVSALAAYRDRQGSLVLATADFEGDITIWRANSKDGLNRHQLPDVDFSISGAHGSADGSDAEVLCLAFVAADAPLLASAGNDRTVRCWGFREHTCILLAVLEGHKDSIEAMVTDGLFLLSGGCDGVVRVWNVASLEHKDQSSVAESAGTSSSSSCRDENGQNDAANMAVGFIKAHANGIAGLAIMTTTTPPSAAGARHSRRSDSYALGEDEGEQGQDTDVGGLLVTCGNAEGIVKIWDYTHVEDGNGGCGRLVAEVRPYDESLFSCIACTQDPSGKPLLFAGTSQGSVLQLDVDGINMDADERKRGVN
eukprot:g8538.t1